MFHSRDVEFLLLKLDFHKSEFRITYILILPLLDGYMFSPQ